MPSPPPVPELLARARAARDRLAADPIVGRFVDPSLDIPAPFIGESDIRLVILGQDPTVQRAASRAAVRTTLNLDRRGSLRRYLAQVTAALGLALSQVYATNVAKCFYTAPPTTLAKRERVDVLRGSADAWLPLLRDELACFPDALVLSLGEPVLGALVREGNPQIMRHYWGHRKGWRDGARGPFSLVEASASTIGRAFHPLVHVGNRGDFYRARRAEYLEWIRHQQ